jgi:tetratricopeptide (TPR) repeat protein
MISSHQERPHGGSAASRLTTALRLVVGVVVFSTIAHPAAGQESIVPLPASSEADALERGQQLFYSGRYEAAAALARTIPASGTNGAAASELLTTALLFQIKRALGTPTDKDNGWDRCSACPELLVAFHAAVAAGQRAARATLDMNPDDEEALFLLGKIDLNYVWLLLGTLGRKTGWGEYWEARRALDKVLKLNAEHVRARVARAWIDYIVDTKMPRGTKWLFGGGSRKRGLRAVQDAASEQSAFFVRAEARFALWDMQVRERNLPAAIATARTLAHDFPDNQELHRFIETHDRTSPQ